MTTTEHLTPHHQPLDLVALSFYYRQDAAPEPPFDPWEERLTLEQYIIDAAARGIPTDEITGLATAIQGPLTEDQMSHLDQTGRKQAPRALTRRSPEMQAKIGELIGGVAPPEQA
jgi:hypothetical protein